MKNIDFTPLIQNDIEYQILVQSVCESYKGDWDDKIHDSYLRYVNQVQEQSQMVHEIRCKAEILQKEVEELQIEEIHKTANSLCKEAYSV